MSTKADGVFNSISDIASRQTDRKEPPKNPNAKPEEKKVEEKPVDNNETSKPSEFYTEKKTEEKKPEEKKPIVDEASIKASGETGAYLIGGMIETGFGLIERLIYLSKFTKSEKEKLIALQSKPEAEFTPLEKNLNRKFLSLKKNSDEKRERIPLTEKDENALANVCAEYTRITGKSANPQLMIYATVSKVLISRSIDIFLD